MEHSDYIVFLDESGDTNLKSISSDYPVFVLSCCIFKKSDYSGEINQKFLNLKFKWFGHDAVIFRGYNMRKAKGSFAFLGFKNKAYTFYQELNSIISSAPFTIISTIVDKQRYKSAYSSPIDTYEIALKFCMERTYMYLQGLGQANRRTYFIIESRGEKEDNTLELSFRRIRDRESYIQGGMPNLEIKFVDKKANSVGLQLADLVGTPIGHNYLNPSQQNRAYQILENKFRKSSSGKIEGYGKKVCP